MIHFRLKFEGQQEGRQGRRRRHHGAPHQQRHHLSLRQARQRWRPQCCPQAWSSAASCQDGHGLGWGVHFHSCSRFFPYPNPMLVWHCCCDLIPATNWYCLSNKALFLMMPWPMILPLHSMWCHYIKIFPLFFLQKCHDNTVYNRMRVKFHKLSVLNNILIWYAI